MNLNSDSSLPAESHQEFGTDPVLIAGPTASGKSEIALALAVALQGEIISVDSMQVYRGLDIGTSKPTFAERIRVPHHLLDVVDLADGSFDAARFVAETERAVREIRQRGRLPILCGGTGLYFNAWLKGLGAAPPPDLVLRAELETLPLETLLEELARKDQVCFDTIDRKNHRRIVRAIEVIRITGKPFSGQRSLWSDRAPVLRGRSFGLKRTREDLLDRIHQRVDRMFAEGLVAETGHLLPRGLERNRTALQAIGYRQVVEHIQGVRGLGETVELVKSKTRQYARRQRTWFERQLTLDWISLEAHGTVESTVVRIRESLRKG